MVLVGRPASQVSYVLQGNARFRVLRQHPISAVPFASTKTQAMPTVAHVTMLVRQGSAAIQVLVKSPVQVH